MNLYVKKRKYRHVKATRVTKRLRDATVRVDFHDCEFSNPDGNAVEYLNGRVRFFRCKFTAMDYCFWLSNGQNNVAEFHDCSFVGLGRESIIRAYRCKRLLFSDCSFTGPSPNEQGSIKSSIRAYGVDDLVVRNCQFAWAGAMRFGGKDAGDDSTSYTIGRCRLVANTGSFRGVMPPCTVTNVDTLIYKANMFSWNGPQKLVVC